MPIENERFGGEAMTDVADIQALILAVGEMRGQMREIIHTSNNTAQKVDTLAVSVSMAASLPELVAGLTLRVAALERSDSRRDGATGIITAIMKSPAIGWLVGAAITAWAVLTGKVNI